MLEIINAPSDLGALTEPQLKELADEIRTFLVQHVSKTGGHLGPNLGVVELTIALHRAFESPKDTLVFDTGHQAYVHKILTGRQDFSHLRQKGGLSGYPSRRESEHDVVENSHASTALSWADGVAKAKHILGNDDRFVVAVIGDGALTGGMAWEALNNIAESDLPIIIVVNDNGRSYAPTHGGLAHHFDTLRATQGYEQFMRRSRHALLRSGPLGREGYQALRRLKRGIKEMVAPQGLFEDLGIKYLGPIDGHDIGEIEKAFHNAKSLRRPVIVHTITEKGHGYEPAENHELDKFHNVGPIHPETGLPMVKSRWGWTSVFSDELVKIGATHPEVVAITAAMLEPVGLSKFAEAYPDRTFDVGIAEQHAAASAAGLAFMGMHPVVAVYATFLNRAFDQILMDVGLHNAGVTFVLDRAGVTGDDGASHNGIWDFTLLRMVPGVRIAAPRDEDTLRLALNQAIAVKDGPTVVRFPKGELPPPFPALENRGEVDILWKSLESGSISSRHSAARSEARQIAESQKPKQSLFRVLIVGYGAMIPGALSAAEKLLEDDPALAVDVVTTTWVWPVLGDLIEMCRDYDLVVTVEDGLAAGGIGSGLEEAAAALDIVTPHVNLGVPTKFLPHATRDQVFRNLQLDSEAIASQVLQHVKKFKV